MSTSQATLAQNRGFFQKRYAAYVERQNKALLTELIRTDMLRPHLTPSELALFICAGLVHVSTIALALLGEEIIIASWPLPIPILFGLLFLGIVWAVRPKLGNVSKRALLRKDYPTLYMLLDRIAAEMHTPTIDAVEASALFNCAISRVGIARKSVLYLGIPLWESLDDEEKIALLCHEMAHQVNHDSERGMFVGAAIDTLREWYDLIAPPAIYRRGSLLPVAMWRNRVEIRATINAQSYISHAGVGEVLGKMIMYVLSRLPLLWIYLLSMLHLPNSRRAEYLADHLAATVAGTSAMLTILEKLYFVDVYNRLLRRLLARGVKDADFYTLLRQHITTMSASELEEAAVREDVDTADRNKTHPPPSYRAELLKTKPAYVPQISLSAQEAQQINQELKPVRAGVIKALLQYQ